MPEHLAERAQSEWDPTATARKFLHLAAALRAHAMAPSRGQVSLVGGVGASFTALRVDVRGDGMPGTRWTPVGATPLQFRGTATVGPFTLLVGGLDAAGNSVATLSVVDPSTGDIVDSPVSLAVARSSPGVAVDGCLLHVTGGFRVPTASTAAVETFKVSADGGLARVSTAYADLPGEREGHAGGMRGGDLVLVGGLGAAGALGDAVALSRDGGVASLGDVLGAGRRRGHAALVALSGGSTLALGGLVDRDTSVVSDGGAQFGSEVLQFDPDVRATPGPPLLRPRGEAAAATLPAGVLVTGGCSAESLSCRDSSVDTVEWIPWGAERLGGWNGTSPAGDGGARMAADREGPVAVFLDRRVYVGGGNDTGAGWEWFGLDADGEFDGTRGPAGAAGPPLPRRGACAYQDDHTAWILGGVEPDGNDRRYPAELQRCDLSMDPVTCSVADGGPRLVSPRAWHACAVVRDRLYVVGGEGPGGGDGGVRPVLDVEQFDLRTTVPVSLVLDGGPFRLQDGMPEASAAWDGDELVVVGKVGSQFAANRIVFPASEGGPLRAAEGFLGAGTGSWAAVRVGRHLVHVGGPSPTDITWVHLGGGVETGRSQSLVIPVVHPRVVRLGANVCAFGGTREAPGAWPRNGSNTLQCAPLVR